MTLKLIICFFFQSMQDDDPLITGNQNNLINVGELNTEEPNIEDQVVEVIAEPQIDNNRAEVVDETPSITDDSSSSGSDFEEIDSSGRPKKGRKRKYAHQSRDIRKKGKIVIKNTFLKQEKLCTLKTSGIFIVLASVMRKCHLK
ncbi:hypothetical protein J6590_108401 [Homalodisca vitripennis]|nr:hypothetical protein J6590_108401 [Homalodisca vitripennis]